MMMIIAVVICVQLLCLVIPVIGSSNQIYLSPRSKKITASSFRMKLFYEFEEVAESVMINCMVIDLLENVKKDKSHARQRRDVGESPALKDSFPLISETPETIYLSKLVEKKPEEEKVLPDENLAPINLDLDDTEKFPFNKQFKKRMRSDIVALTDIALEPSKNWKLKQEFIPVKKGLSASTIELFYLLEVNETVKGNLQILCHANDSQKLKTDARIAYHLIMLPTLNLTSQELQSERHYSYPQYIDLAPCPCDLLHGSCDMHCCCDEDCSQLSLESFSCTEKSKKNIFENVFKNKNFFSIVYMNSPFIDYFYPLKSIVATSEAFDQLRNLAEDGIGFPFPNLNISVDYVKGSPITIKKGWHVHYWRLPSSPVCNLKKQSIIHFLENMSSHCTSYLTEDNCGENLFSVHHYLNVITEPNGIFSKLHETSVAPTEVLYFCIDNVNNYKRTRNAFSSFEQMAKIELTGISQCQNQTFETLFEDNTCINSVMEVHFVVLWNGPKITQVKMMILIANISVPAHFKENIKTNYLGVTIKQLFSVHFEHDPDSTRKEYGTVELDSSSIVLPIWQQDSTSCKKSKMKFSAGYNLNKNCWIPVPMEHQTNCSNYLSFLCKMQNHFFQMPEIQDELEPYVVLRNKSLCETPMKCDFLPTHIQTEILYADQAQHNVPSKFQILGINISIVSVPCLPEIGMMDTNDVAFEESKINQTFCKPSSTVMLTHTIQSLPANLHIRAVTKRYWYQSYPAACSELGCWEELFYPITKDNEGDELIAYPVLFFVSFIAVGIIIAVISV